MRFHPQPSSPAKITTGTRRRWASSLSVVIGCLFLLSACGGGKSKPTPTPTIAPTIAAPTTVPTTAGLAVSTKTPITGNAATGNAEATLSAAITQSAGLEPTYSAMSTAVANVKFSVDSCTVVSKSDMEKILGTSLTADPQSDPEAHSCDFTAGETTITLMAAKKSDIEALMKAAGQSGNVDDLFKQGQDQAKSEDGYKEVSGVGDQAYYTTDSGLSARKGDNYVQVSGGTLDQDTAIAKKALSNM